MSSSTGVKFRELDPNNSGEIGFIYKSWLGSYRNSADVIPYSMYRKLYQALLDRIIKRDGCLIILAVTPDDLNHILGFAVLERASATLHYIYVKADYRCSGVGTDLLEFINEGNLTGEFEYTFNSSLGRKFLRKRGGRHNARFVRGDNLP